MHTGPGHWQWSHENMTKGLQEQANKAPRKIIFIQFRQLQCEEGNNIKLNNKKIKPNLPNIWPLESLRPHVFDYLNPHPLTCATLRGEPGGQSSTESSPAAQAGRAEGAELAHSSTRHFIHCYHNRNAKERKMCGGKWGGGGVTIHTHRFPLPSTRAGRRLVSVKGSRWALFVSLG